MLLLLQLQWLIAHLRVIEPSGPYAVEAERHTVPGAPNEL